MKFLRFFAVAMLGLILVAGLVACGSSSSDSSGISSYAASGTYDYNEGTGQLTITIASSTYPMDCDQGPGVGTETFTITDLSATLMEWDDGNEVMGWTGSNSGGITGTWQLAYNGVNYYTLVMNSDGTFTLSSPTTVCSLQ